MNFFKFKTIVFYISRGIYKVFFARFQWGRKLKSWVYHPESFVEDPFKDASEYLLVRHPIELTINCIEHEKTKSEKTIINISNNMPESSSHRKDFADSTFIEIKDCKVFGGSSFIVRDEYASTGISQNIIDIHSKYNEYYFQEEMHKRISYDPNKRMVKIKDVKPKIQLLGKWISSLSANSENWMHVLSEHLPRIAKMIEKGKDLHFGILHDDVMPPTALEGLKIISEGRPMISVTPDWPIKVSCLLVPKEEKFEHCAFWPRNNYQLKASYKGSYTFDTEAILLLRYKILDYFNIIPKGECRSFIKRKTTFRMLLNRNEIEQTLSNSGFEVIEPSSLTLFSQASIFSKTSLLVSQGCAALANMIFMPKGARVVCIAPSSDYVDYNYFYEYAKLLGIELTYALGEVNNPSSYDSSAICKEEHPMNADYFCSIEKIMGACQGK
jgi:hypothetical protein